MDFPVPDFEPIMAAIEIGAIALIAVTAFYIGLVCGGFCK